MQIIKFEPHSAQVSGRVNIKKQLYHQMQEKFRLISHFFEMTIKTKVMHDYMLAKH